MQINANISILRFYGKGLVRSFDAGFDLDRACQDGFTRVMASIIISTHVTISALSLAMKN